jgi:acylglycerol lipase
LNNPDTGVRHTTANFASFDGTVLAYHIWEPEQLTPGAPVALIHHGAAYHGGAYVRLARSLAGVGIASLALDVRGHGRSEGQRGNLERSSTVLRDLTIATGIWRERHPDRRLVLIGESMGGLVALLQAARARRTPARVDALVLSAPGILIQPQHVFNRDSLRGALRSVLQRDSTSFARPADRQSRPARRHATSTPGGEAEQLALTGFSANYMMIVAGMSIHSPGAAVRIRVPTLIMHGKQDDVVPYHGSVLLYHMLATRDKELSLYDGAGHTLFWSPEGAPVYDDLIGWIKQRFPDA